MASVVINATGSIRGHSLITALEKGITSHRLRPYLRKSHPIIYYASHVQRRETETEREREHTGLVNSSDVRIFGWFDSWGNYSDAAAGWNQLWWAATHIHTDYLSLYVSRPSLSISSLHSLFAYPFVWTPLHVPFTNMSFITLLFSLSACSNCQNGDLL